MTSGCKFSVFFCDIREYVISAVYVLPVFPVVDYVLGRGRVRGGGILRNPCKFVANLFEETPEF